MSRKDLYQQTSLQLEAALDKIIQHGFQTLGPKFLNEAWCAFSSWVETTYPYANQKQHQLFLTWVAYDWRLLVSHEYGQKLSLNGRPTTLAEHFLHNNSIDEDLKSIIHHNIHHTLSFFEVREVNESTITLDDLLLHQVLKVTHPWKAQQCRSGDILFGIPCGNENLLTIASCRRIIPGKIKSEVTRFSQWTKKNLTVPLTACHLHSYHPEIFELFWTIQHHLIKGNPRILPDGVIASPSLFQSFSYLHH